MPFSRHECIGQNPLIEQDFVPCPRCHRLVPVYPGRAWGTAEELLFILREVPMKRLSGLLAFVAFLSFGVMSTLSFAGDPTPAEQKDKKESAGPKMSDDKKEEKKDKGGHVVFGDDKKDEKKEKGGK